MREIFYVLHILGMGVIVACSVFLLILKDLVDEQKKKFSLYLMSAAHTQLLTGLILFFLLLSEVNHMKIGIKILFAIEIAILATIIKKKIYSKLFPGKILILSILLSAIITTLIAFLM